MMSCILDFRADQNGLRAQDMRHVPGIASCKLVYGMYKLQAAEQSSVHDQPWCSAFFGP
jgi:hypothetical protein